MELALMELELRTNPGLDGTSGYRWRRSHLLRGHRQLVDPFKKK